MTTPPEPEHPAAYGSPPGGGWTPVPDPTTLTNELVGKARDDLRREIGSLREILEARMSQMDAERGLLLKIMDERTAETQRRFDERDLRFGERDAARTEAVRTALNAAKELSDARDASADKAIEKFEVSVREQIAQIGELAESGRQQLSTQIQGLKERLDRGEGGDAGAATAKTERRLDTGQAYTAASVLLGFLVLALSLYAALHR